MKAPKSYLNLDVGLEPEWFPGYKVPPVAGQGGRPVPGEAPRWCARPLAARRACELPVECQNLIRVRRVDILRYLRLP